MKTSWIWLILALLVLGLGLAYAKNTNLFGFAVSAGGIACTAEAMQCPDGSYVGRTGPSCSFAPCPTPTTPATSTAETSLNQRVTVAGITITPLAIVEDSRCPVDVECIQAGTVRVRASVGSAAGTSTIIMTLGKVATTSAATLVLTDVTPTKHEATTIAPSDYQFTFDVSPSAKTL